MLHRGLLMAAIAAAIFTAAAALPTGGVLAGQLLTNGDFSSGMAGWRAESRTVTLKIDAQSDRAHSGVKMELVGSRLKGNASISQEIQINLQPGEKSTLSFSWRKNWKGAEPKEQSATVQIIRPDGKAVDVWSDVSISSADVWNAVSIDASSFIDREGIYSVRFSASFESGGGNGAASLISYDSISFNAPLVLSQPRTIILSPTGSSTLHGDIEPVIGVTSGSFPISKVELALVRLKDGFYWNGGAWVPSESWVDAKILSGRGTKSATWYYSWSLPTADGEKFEVLARGTDVAGNKEWTRAVSPSVDTVAPSGAIFINDAASYTRSNRVRIDVRITGATGMRFSADGGKTWSKWETFRESIEIPLPRGDGMKIVTGEFRDDFGNFYKTSDNIVFDTTPPVTKMTYPAPGANNVKSSTTIGAVFYEEMSGTSFKNDGTEAGSTFYVKRGSTWVPGSVIYDNATKTAKFIPDSPLEEGTTYGVYLTGVEDAAGNRLAANYSWSFTIAGTSKLSLSGRVTKASGGKIADGDGSVELSVPADAVKADAIARVDEVKEAEAPSLTGLMRFSGIYIIGLDDLKLLKPATFRVKYQPSEGIDSSTIQIFAYDKANGQWKPLDTRLDFTANAAAASVNGSTLLVVASRADSGAPTTAILDPTGYSVLSGSVRAIIGLSSDDISVSRVEVAIVRLKDGFYWDGSTWSASESWMAARIINGKGTKGAAWSYTWSLPPADGQKYRILARSIDGSGNRELDPAVAYVEMSGK